MTKFRPVAYGGAIVQIPASVGSSAFSLHPGGCNEGNTVFQALCEDGEALSLDPWNRPGKQAASFSPWVSAGVYTMKKIEYTFINCEPLWMGPFVLEIVAPSH